MLIEGVLDIVEKIEKKIEKLAQELEPPTQQLGEAPTPEPVAPTTKPTIQTPVQYPEEPTLPDIGPPRGPRAPGLAPGEVPGGYTPELKPETGTSIELPEFADKMSEADLINLISLSKILAQAIKNGDTMALSYATNMIKKLFQKYKKPLTEPYFSIYSFWRKLESLKRFQNKNQLVNVSAKKLASTLSSMNARAASSRVLSIETYDFEKISRSGRVVWGIDFVHSLVPKLRHTIRIGVKVHDLIPEVDTMFEDIKGIRRPFDSVTLEMYAKGQLK